MNCSIGSMSTTVADEDKDEDEVYPLTLTQTQTETIEAVQLLVALGWGYNHVDLANKCKAASRQFNHDAATIRDEIDEGSRPTIPLKVYYRKQLNASDLESISGEFWKLYKACTANEDDEECRVERIRKVSASALQQVGNILLDGSESSLRESESIPGIGVSHYESEAIADSGIGMQRFV
jgi:hypothetical protein